MKKAMIERIVIYVIGIFILALGLVLNSKAGLGVSPIISVAYASSIMSGISYGMCTTIEYIVLVVIEMIILRKIDLMIILQIPFSYAFGVLMDVYDRFIIINHPSFLMGLIILLFAVIATAIGAYLMVSMELITNPGDGYVNAFAQRFNKPFGKTKLCVDASMIVITVTVSLIIKHHVIGIGLGTVIAFVLTGNFISVCDHLTGVKLAKIVLKSRGH